MRVSPCIIAALLLFAPLAGHAQSLSARLADAPHIPAEEWRALTAGKTVVYEIDGEVFGYESYRTNSNQITMRLADGLCINGQWFMDQNAFCFNWEDGPLNCFNHKRLDSTVYVIGLENGVETDDIQRVLRIAPIPVACGPALLSQLEPEVSP